MSFVTVPGGVNGIVDDLKSAYEKLKPSIKVASKAYKDAKSGKSQEIEAGVSAPPLQEPDPSSRGGIGSIPNWALYAGAGAIILGFFYFRSGK